jgi:hypothetical protein
VRVSPIVGDKAWFAPRRLGWGLSPVSPEGWLVTVAVVALSVIAKRRDDLPAWFGPALMAPFIVLLLLKGTSPGGPRARSEFDAHRGASTAGDTL